MSKFALVVLMFSLMVGTAIAAPGKITLSWGTPTTYEDGSPLPSTDIGGYTLSCGLTAGSHPTVKDAGKVNTYVFTGLIAGTTYYCVGNTYLTGKTVFGADSNEVSKAAVAIAPSTLILTAQ